MIGGGGRRSGSRKRDANTASTKPGTPIQMNAVRHPYVVLRDDRLRGGPIARLAKSHECAAAEQLPEAAHQASCRRRRAPNGDAPRDDAPPRSQIADHAEGERGQREDDDVRRTEPAELRVGEVEIAFDGLEHRVDDVAVEIIEEVDERQQTQDVSGIRPGYSRLLRHFRLGAPPPVAASARASRSAFASRYESVSSRIISVRLS